MLADLLGIRLVLLIGKIIPLPAPLDLVGALSAIEVTNDARGSDGFQLTFELTKLIPLDYDVMLTGSMALFNRVVIGVVIGITPTVLIDGIITQHQLTPSSEPGQSTLTVTGQDISVLMDLEEKRAPFKNQTDSVIVRRTLLSYMQYGILPGVIAPTVNIEVEVQGQPWQQQETDLRFIQRLATQNSFVFYIEPVTFGVTKAYWGPENRVGFPQPALKVHMGVFSNVESLSFTNDGMAPVAASGDYLESLTGMQFPVPALPALRLPPLAPIPALPQRKILLNDLARMSVGEALLASIAAATSAPEAVSGQGQLQTVRYGSVLKARGLVGVTGAGFAHDGFYYVSRVTHSLKRGEYTQSFSLSRDGTGSLSPVVP
jgi:hypothetical protein